VRLVGTASLDPITARFAVDARDVDVTPYQPYLTDKVNLVLTGGRIGTKGELTYDARAAGGSKIDYRGSAGVTDFSSVEQETNQDLLKWKSLALDGLEYSSQPFQLRIGEITLADFYSRLILGADGKTNLQKLTAEGTETAEPATQASAPPPAPAETEATPKPISIGKINLQSGNINFSDFFIKPNYSANLTSVEGAISELNREAPGDVELKAKLDESAPVDIKGKINPFSKDLFLDLVADAREIELSPMTPYSGKYLGYGIEKGKLSFNVKYKLEDRKLTAQNKIILNQLTFGDKIESPTATKLPVLFAVSLLKDRNGVIDVDLPISGSLDDPQFSVGGIVLRIIINLITKAVTAPFSLLGSVFGGTASGGEELSYIEFASGRANLDQAAQAKIGTLAKALNNRPALNLEITGRYDPISDVEGAKQLSIERKVKAQKLKELARKGAAPRSVDDVQVDKSEYAEYLKAAYGEEKFPKPRNLIGLAQDLPVPEMEKLMTQHTQVSDDDLRQLGNQRAQAVRDALVSSGQVGSERLFVVAAKPVTAEERTKLKGKPNRVDFAMK
jgi:outer membrane protein OmpA-like peptidoglycan-associated protein